MRALLALVLPALLSCSDAGERQALQERRAQREAKAKAHAASPPAVQVHAVGPNQVLVLQLPVADEFGNLERQQCVVWRDLELRTSSMACPGREVFLER
jgi:hypothetical protein